MCQYGIIYLILFNGKWCKYIGPISEGLTYEEYYVLLVKKNDEYYFLNDFEYQKNCEFIQIVYIDFNEEKNLKKLIQWIFLRNRPSL